MPRLVHRSLDSMRAHASASFLLCAWLVTPAQAQEHSTLTRAEKSIVYVCEKGETLMLRNTLPSADDAARCQRKTITTRATVPTVVRTPHTYAPRPTLYPRRWDDPQPTDQTVMVGAQIAPEVQMYRDQKRHDILRNELRTAQEQLNQLEHEYQGGTPERRGDEKNYAKYQQRTAQLAQSIQLTRANIDALQRELARMQR